MAYLVTLEFHFDDDRLMYMIPGIVRLYFLLSLGMILSHRLKEQHNLYM